MTSVNGFERAFEGLTAIKGVIEGISVIPGLGAKGAFESITVIPEAISAAVARAYGEFDHDAELAGVDWHELLRRKPYLATGELMQHELDHLARARYLFALLLMCPLRELAAPTTEHVEDEPVPARPPPRAAHFDLSPPAARPGRKAAIVFLTKAA